jgi:hypothetical protein
MIDHAPMASIQTALQELYGWATRQDFAGYDPHDLLSSPTLRRIKNPFARLLALQLGRRSAINLHRLLHVPRAENPKALALFIMGLLRARDKAVLNWMEEAERLAKRLLASMHEDGG